MLHDKAGASHPYYTDADFGMVRAYQGKLIGASYLFDQQAVVAAIGACLNTWVMGLSRVGFLEKEAKRQQFLIE